MDKIIIIGMMDSRKDEIAEYLSKQADFETEITKLIKAADIPKLENQITKMKADTAIYEAQLADLKK